MPDPTGEGEPAMPDPKGEGEPTMPDPKGEGEPAMPDPKGEGDLAMDKTETLPLAPPHSSASASLQSDEAARLQRPNSPGLSEAAAASLAASSRGGFSRPADEVYWLQRVFANGLAASRARANEAADVRAALMLRFSSRFSSTTKAGDSPAPSLRGATGFPLLAEAFLFCRPGRSWQPEEPADVGSPSVWAADRVFYAPLLFPKIAEFAAKLGLDPNERYARWDPEREGFVFATVKSDLLCLAARGAVGCPADGVGAPDRANFARALRALASN